MISLELPRLSSLGHELDLSPEAFGELRESNDILDDVPALRARMDEDGYVFFRDYLDVDWVMDARREILRRIKEGGGLDPNHPDDEAVTGTGPRKSWFGHNLAVRNLPLEKLLYTGRMIEYYERFLGGPVRHFDYTWFRAVGAGRQGIYPHCDVVYMGRGTWNLFTSWTPIGDVPVELGGLMVLEGSHKKREQLKNYMSRDVDTYCVNRSDAADIESGKKQWIWDGKLALNPVTLRKKLGGRWLTTNFRAGDVLTFTVLTVHASLDNQTNRFRLSSDSRYQLASEPVDERWIGENPPAHGPNGKRGFIC
jgi:hypothetical protein